MNRKDFIKALALLPLSAAAMKLQDLRKVTDTFQNTSLMPVWFIGHGNPMNVIQDNPFTRKLMEMGKSIAEKPNAILVVSAHWLTMRNTFVTVTPKPETIYDFGGFPEEMYKIKYPAPGAPEMAREVKNMVKSIEIQEDDHWGLDHGSWTVLKHMFPEADIPVFQISIDYSKPPQFHYDLARELMALRRKGVLIIGSGNIVHNLRRADFHNTEKPYDWAIEFDEISKQKILSRDFNALINYHNLGQSAALAIPTSDHYLPMIYTLGLVNDREEIRFTYEEIQNASISMRCFQVG
jgi:4,5-DOPA dioxygenase extradiol